MQRRGNICDRGTAYHDVGHDGNKSVFLYIEWAGIQGKRVAKHRNTILWKNPLQELAQWERNEYGEEDGDCDIWDYATINIMSANRCRKDLHLNEMTVLKAGMIAEKSIPRNHLKRDQ